MTSYRTTILMSAAATVAQFSQLAQADAAPETAPAEGGNVPSISEQASVEGVTSDGVRTRKAFMLRQFIPETDWIMKNVVAKGKGHKEVLGRVYGVVTGTDTRTNVLPDGKEVQSIVLKGVIMSESYITGEVGQAATAYLPDAYASKIVTMFTADQNLKLVEIDCDIGVEATGKTIPYEWVVIAFRDGEEMAVLKRMKASRSRPASAFTLPAPGATAALEGPKAK